MTTVEEWQTYILSIPDSEIFEQVTGANTVTFVKSLQNDGFMPMEIESILRMFAQRMVSLGLALPTRVGYMDLNCLVSE